MRLCEDFWGAVIGLFILIYKGQRDRTVNAQGSSPPDELANHEMDEASNAWLALVCLFASASLNLS